jgi:hypothetical protein
VASTAVDSARELDSLAAKVDQQPYLDAGGHQFIQQLRFI